MQLTFEQMMASGMHLGHQTRKWHPKMAAYTYGVRKGLHLLDLVKTRQQLLEARSFLAQQASEGKTRLFVGTKPQAARTVSEAARRARCFYVNERWLGGMLTNWRTVRSSLVRLHELERQERRGEWNRLPKKEAAQLRQLKDRLVRYVGGLKGMRRLPDVVIVIGQQQELAAIAEARRLGLPVVSLLDTDCDPELVQIGIPRNDDSAESIQLILEELVSAWREGLRVCRQRPVRSPRIGGRKPENLRSGKRARMRLVLRSLSFFGCYKTKPFQTIEFVAKGIRAFWDTRFLCELRNMRRSVRSVSLRGFGGDVSVLLSASGRSPPLSNGEANQRDRPTKRTWTPKTVTFYVSIAYPF